MKKYFINLSIICVFLALQSCREINDPVISDNGPKLFEVHLWGFFDDDRVKIRIDGVTQFDDYVTANVAVDNVKSVKASLDGTYNPHVITAVINDQYSGSMTFTSSDTLIVTVSFDPAVKKFSFSVLNKKPLYG